jgi:hypothetical protein
MPVPKRKLLRADLSLKHVGLFLVVAISAGITIRGFNRVFYDSIDVGLMAEVLFGPLLIWGLLSLTYKEWRAPCLMAVLALAGTAGILELAEYAVRIFVGELTSEYSIHHIFHAAASVTFVVAFFVWDFLRKNKI